MLSAMHDLHWLVYGMMPRKRRIPRLLRARALTEARLGELEAGVAAMKARLELIDNALSDYMLGGKQGGE